MPSSRTVLVTGGAGFLGSRLCELMVERGDQVICLDNLHTGAAKNIEHLQARPGFRLVRQDVCDPVDLKVDEIYNFACPASPPQYQADPVRTMRTSVLGALNMLSLAERCGAKIMQASTSEVYGDPLVHPQSEDYLGNVNTIGIRACYDEGKRAAETLFYDYRRTHGVNIRVVRIFNTYGPRMFPADGRVVSNFIVQALRGENLTVYGEGRQTRSFCYRDDLIDGILSLMDAADDVHLPVNLGNPDEFTILELAELVLELTGSRSKLSFRPLPQDDPMQRCPDISRARQHLGWEPKTGLRLGLVKTIAYVERLLAREPAEALSQG